jgi:hypothetical protein
MTKLVDGGGNGTSTAHLCRSSGLQYEVSGTLDGATVTIEYLLPGGTYTVLDGISITTVDVNRLDVVPNSRVRFVTAGGGGSISHDIVVADEAIGYD